MPVSLLMADSPPVDLNYKADNCDLDLTTPFRFPCQGGSTQSCTNNEMMEWVLSCYSSPPYPDDLLPNNTAVCRVLPA